MPINSSSILEHNLPTSDFFYAMDIVAANLEKKNDGFKEQYDIDVNHLFDYLGGQGASPTEYLEFLQWLSMLMLKPKNSKALHARFFGKGPSYLANLLDFFKGMEENGEEELTEWLIFRNCKDYQRDTSLTELSIWWREYVNPSQEVIKEPTKSLTHGHL